MFREFNAKEEGYQEMILSSLDIFFIEFVRQSPNPNAVVTTAASYTQ